MGIHYISISFDPPPDEVERETQKQLESLLPEVFQSEVLSGLTSRMERGCNLTGTTILQFTVGGSLEQAQADGRKLWRKGYTLGLENHCVAIARRRHKIAIAGSARKREAQKLLSYTPPGMDGCTDFKTIVHEDNKGQEPSWFQTEWTTENQATMKACQDRWNQDRLIKKVIASTNNPKILRRETLVAGPTLWLYDRHAYLEETLAAAAGKDTKAGTKRKA